MRVRLTPSVAWAGAALVCLLLAAASVQALTNLPAFRDPELIGSFAQAVIPTLGIGFIGALVASRLPNNRIGWILLVAALTNAVPAVLVQYLIHTLLVARGSLPAVEWVAWVNSIASGITYPALVVVMMLFFPDGHLPSRRWHWLVWAAVGYAAGNALVGVLDPTPILSPGLPPVHNPTGLTIGRGLEAGPLGWVSFFGAMVIVLLAVASLVVRLRRAPTVERQQVRWVVYALGVFTVLNILLSLSSLFLPPSPEGRIIGNVVSNVLIVAGFGVALPAAIGIAILKYRLYEIDIVISRTLVFGALAVFIFNSANFAIVARQAQVVAATDVFAFLAGTAWIPFALMLLLFLPLLFPDGRLLSRRWWLPIISGAIFAVLALLGNVFVASNPAPGEAAVINPLANPSLAHAFQPFINLAVPFGLAALLGSWASVVVRYRRGGGLQRHQLRWFFFALVLAATPFVLHDVNQTVANALLLVCVPLLPVSIAVAVLRYRLYDIDVVINRALVYGALAGFITAVYVGIVVGAGGVVGSGGRPNLFLSIVATAVVAVAFQPVRERVQRFANRLVYGKRANPYEVMANFSERMADTLAPDAVLPRMAEVAARGVAAEAARVGVRFRDGSARVVWWPAEPPHSSLGSPVAITYRGEVVGDIAVAKAPGAPVTPAEAKLLNDLAAQAGLVVHNIRLTADLQAHLDELTAQAEAIRASRQRLVSAATAERERLQQTIRDGPEGALTVLGAKLQGVEALAEEDPAQAAVALDGLNGDVQRTLDGLRQLAHGLYPPLLRDQGLVAALRSQTAKSGLPVEIVTQSVDRYAAEIESAIYFASLEVIRLAQGMSRVEVTGGNGAVHFSVVAPGWAGHSIQAIEDRVEALGGHLESSDGGVAGTIPVPSEASARLELT